MQYDVVHCSCMSKVGREAGVKKDLADLKMARHMSIEGNFSQDSKWHV